MPPRKAAGSVYRQIHSAASHRLRKMSGVNAGKHREMFFQKRLKNRYVFILLRMPKCKDFTISSRKICTDYGKCLVSMRASTERCSSRNASKIDTFLFCFVCQSAKISLSRHAKFRQAHRLHSRIKQSKRLRFLHSAQQWPKDGLSRFTHPHIRHFPLEPV